MEDKIKKYEKANKILFYIALISIILFILRLYSIIPLPMIDRHPKGFILLALLAGLAFFISSLLDIRIARLEGQDLNHLSLALDIILSFFIIAYAIFQFKMPVGYCPFKDTSNYIKYLD